MTEQQKLAGVSLAYWQQNVVEFIETYLVHPESRQPYKLYPAEKTFIEHMFKTGADGRLVFSDLVFSAPKKSGKTEFGALMMIVMILLFGGSNAEGYCVANDLEQATSRVFERCRLIIQASPLLRHEAKITSDKIFFTSTGGFIVPLASDYASAAGGHPTLSVHDEIWASSSERARRLFDELVPVPSRQISARLIVSHAGFQGEGQLLYELFQHGTKQPQVGPDLYAGNGQLTLWAHGPISPDQTDAWRADMRRKLRPHQYARMIENEFTVAESNFINPELWDAIVNPSLTRKITDRSLLTFGAVDASVKHDSTGLFLVTWLKDRQCVQTVDHRIFKPSPDVPIDFENQIERTILDWHHRFNVKAFWYDPFQMESSAQRLRQKGVRMVEFPQTPSNLTQMGENLFNLIRGRNLSTYPDDEIRTAVLRAIAVEGNRGWKIDKVKQSHHIDIVIALGMAALAAVRAQVGAFDLMEFLRAANG